jgi:hypothetical protein
MAEGAPHTPHNTSPLMEGPNQELPPLSEIEPGRIRTPDGDMPIGFEAPASPVQAGEAHGWHAMNAAAETQIAANQAERERAAAAEQAARDHAAAVEARRNSPGTAALNTAATISIFGSQGQEYVSTHNASGELKLADAAHPIKGVVEDMAHDIRYGKTPKERREAADKYLEDVHSLITEHDLEISQAKMVMDGRAQWQSAVANQRKNLNQHNAHVAGDTAMLAAHYTAQGIDPEEAQAKASTAVAAKYKNRQPVPVTDLAGVEARFIDKLHGEGIFSWAQFNDYRHGRPIGDGMIGGPAPEAGTGDAPEAADPADGEGDDNPAEPGAADRDPAADDPEQPDDPLDDVPDDDPDAHDSADAVTEEMPAVEDYELTADDKKQMLEEARQTIRNNHEHAKRRRANDSWKPWDAKETDEQYEARLEAAAQDLYQQELTLHELMTPRPGRNAQQLQRDLETYARRVAEIEHPETRKVRTHADERERYQEEINKEANQILKDFTLKPDPLTPEEREQRERLTPEERERFDQRRFTDVQWIEVVDADPQEAHPHRRAQQPEQPADINQRAGADGWTSAAMGAGARRTPATPQPQRPEQPADTRTRHEIMTQGMTDEERAALTAEGQRTAEILQAEHEANGGDQETVSPRRRLAGAARRAGRGIRDSVVHPLTGRPAETAPADDEATEGDAPAGPQEPAQQAPNRRRRRGRPFWTGVDDGSRRGGEHRRNGDQPVPEVVDDAMDREQAEREAQDAALARTASEIDTMNSMSDYDLQRMPPWVIGTLTPRAREAYDARMAGIDSDRAQRRDGVAS